MDFVSDALFDGRRLRALTLLDVYTDFAMTNHEPVAFEAATRAVGQAHAADYVTWI